MFPTNLNTFLFQQPILYPYGYQFILVPQPMNTQYTQLFPIQGAFQQVTSPEMEPIQTPGHQLNSEKKIISETESKIDSDSNDIEIKETPIHKQTNQKIVGRKSQKPNFLAKSTNIQKNYAKAIVSYACRQRSIVQQMLGEHRASEFLKLMNKLRNKLRNISHITRYTHQTDFLSLFRVLGNNFLRKESTSYIYNSKIQQKSCHIANKTIVKHSLLKY